MQNLIKKIKASYNGNSRLKQVGFQMDYTPEQIQEIIKCSEDPIYFIENYCKIVSLDHGLVPFKLYECQKRKVQTIINNRKVILMEGRQQGKTITSAACILWYTLFSENKTVAILANKAAAAREVLSRYQGMYENLPLWLQQGVREWNKGSIELENGSKVFTAATASSGIRGKSVNWLYIDEAAIIPNNVAEDFFTSTYPTIMAGETTKVLMSSTPLGYNHFWKFWNDAEQGINDFKNLFIHYTEIPGRDERWAAEQKGVLGEVKFAQEVLCSFLGSSYTLLDADTLSRMSPKQPIYSKDGLDILEEPIRPLMDAGKIVETGHNYFCIVDTARGVGGDYSAFTVIDTTANPYRIVAKYRDNKVSPLLYPSIIHNTVRQYNNAWVLVEVNDNGQQIADILHGELEYEHMLYVNRNSKTGQVVSGGFGGGVSQSGVRTDKRIKRIGCTQLKTLVETNRLQVWDKDIISEFSTFIEDSKGTYSADEGYHDDLVMTLVLFGWLTTNPYFRDLSDINLRESIFADRIRQVEEDLVPFGFFDNGVSNNVEEKYILEDGDLWTVDKNFNKNWL